MSTCTNCPEDLKEVCIEHYGDEGSPNCAAEERGVAALQSGEAPSQQLKAEILPLLQHGLNCSVGCEGDNDLQRCVKEVVAKLSAI